VVWQKRNLLRKIGTQEYCGLHKEFVAAGIRTTRCAKVAQGREHGLQRQGNDDIAPRTWKGRTEENKRLKGPECKNGVRYRGLRQQFQGKTGIKDPHKMAAVSYEGEDNHDWHQRVELRTPITSGKRRNTQDDPVCDFPSRQNC
jgi:hypothetical protein